MLNKNMFEIHITYVKDLMKDNNISLHSYTSQQLV